MNISRSLLLGTASVAVSVAAVDLMAAGVAFGATEQFSASYPGSGSTATPWNGVSPQDVSLPYFNSSLGTLTSVSIELQDSVSTTVTVKNNAGQKVNGSYTAGYMVAVMPQNATPPISGSLATVEGEALLYTLDTSPALKGHGSFNSGYSDVVGPVTVSGTTSNTFGPTGYTGSGDFVLPAYSTASEVQAMSGGNLTITQLSSGHETVTITYAYNASDIPMPEPGSIMLLGSGLIGLGAMRRKGWLIRGATDWMRWRSDRRRD